VFGPGSRPKIAANNFNARGWTHAIAIVEKLPFGGNCSRNDCSRNAAHAPSFFARKRGFCDRGNALSSRWFFPHVVRSGVPLHRGKLQLKLSLIVHYPKKKKNKVSSIARFARTFILHVFRMTH